MFSRDGGARISIAGQRSMTTWRPGRAGAVGGGLVDDAELHPDRPRADRDRLVDVRAGGVGAAEDVDDVDARAVGEGGQPGYAALAEDLVAGGAGLTGMTRLPAPLRAAPRCGGCRAWGRASSRRRPT